MKLPIQAQPVMRKVSTEKAVIGIQANVTIACQECMNFCMYAVPDEPLSISDCLPLCQWDCPDGYSHVPVAASRPPIFFPPSI